MASIRAIFLVSCEKQLIFSRRFPTVERRLKRKMEYEYQEIPDDKFIINSFFSQVIIEELVQEKFKYKSYKEDLDIDHHKMEELINSVDIGINIENFQYYSECPIISLSIDNAKKVIWPCIYLKKEKLYGIIFPNIDVDKYRSIKDKIYQDNVEKSLNLSNELIDFRKKKLYEEQDISIPSSFTLIENILKYVLTSSNFEENKLQLLITNMVPFGNIIETNITFMLDSLNFLNQRFIPQSQLNQDDNTKNPGWNTKIPAYKYEQLKIIIKQELRFVKFGLEKNEKIANAILCDFSCLAELSRSCEITLPIKETNSNYLGNLRIHPCAKIEDQNMLNNATRIRFIPPHDEFKMGVFEVENFSQDKLPIIGEFKLKESAQNEIKLYLKVNLDQSIISKFEYFFINIPLGHFGEIIKTNIMVQVGEVSLKNKNTTLHWDLQNKIMDRKIELSGTVIYSNKNSQMNGEEKKEFEKDFPQPGKINVDTTEDEYKQDYIDTKKKAVAHVEKNFNLEDLKNKKKQYNSRSDIMISNCYCKLHFKLNNYSIFNIEIDKKSLLFYPKLNPKIDIRYEFISSDYIIWNGLSFTNREFNIPEKFDIDLLKINIEEDNKDK